VAFRGGSKELHQDIVDATKEITDACNLTLDFGLDAATGEFRKWSTQDAEHAAEIRVSFDKNGFFSLVGTDSASPDIGLATSGTGGRAFQCSLNLGGFTVNRPPNWRGVVRHEFLHALGFHHSHQNMRGPCEQAFRWEDDPGYVPTQDSKGGFIADSEQRRPGIYTYLSGHPNFWGEAKVTHNLRTEEDPSVVAGPFDRKSVMLYRFPPLFYKSLPSPCAPEGEGLSLSEGDRRGLSLLYPHSAPELQAIVAHREELIGVLESLQDTELMGFETVTTDYSRSVTNLLRSTLP
jgi:hypothetical protein